MEITKILNNELKLIFDWLCANRLSLNVAKTEFIVFRPPKRSLDKRIVLRLNDTKLFESSKIKYLGVLLDPTLSWNHHINELSKKLSRAIGMIFKIRYDCTQTVLLSHYFSLFHSQMIYGLAVWGNCKEGLLTKLTILQKKALRAITFSDFNAHTSPIFKDHRILRIKYMFIYKTMSLMWDYDHNTLPTSISMLFVPCNKIHTRNLREKSKNKLYTAYRHKNRYGFESFSRNGALILNEAKYLPFYNTTLNKPAFLKSYKNYIFKMY